MTFRERFLNAFPTLRDEKEIVKEIAREIGREEARAEGLDEGKLIGMREVALRILVNHFGSVPAEIEQALEAADKERLLDVATHAGTDTLEQVRARLNLPEHQG